MFPAVRPLDTCTKNRYLRDSERDSARHILVWLTPQSTSKTLTPHSGPRIGPRSAVDPIQSFSIVVHSEFSERITEWKLPPKQESLQSLRKQSQYQRQLCYWPC